jgi:hypothetical protein
MLVRFERHGSTSLGFQELPYLHSKVHTPHFTAVAENWTHKGVKHVQHRERGCHIQDSAFREEAMLGFFRRDCRLTGTTLRELPLGCDIQTQVLIRPYDFDRGLVICPGVMCLPPQKNMIFVLLTFTARPLSSQIFWSVPIAIWRPFGVVGR